MCEVCTRECRPEISYEDTRFLDGAVKVIAVFVFCSSACEQIWLIGSE